MSTPTQTRPSIRDGIHGDEGGPLARKGFAFQDHVAARCCMDMLDGNAISEVWCETYDDVVNLRPSSDGNGDAAEYVQVKSLELDQLWTVAKLCARENGKIGSSLLEQSLSRDIFAEPATFRLITSIPLHSSLRLLRLELTHQDRSPASPEFLALAADIKVKYPESTFRAEKDTTYWLTRTHWEHLSPVTLPHENIGKMHKTLNSLGYSPDPATCQEVYQRLLCTLKEAAELQWAEREGRKFTRQRLTTVLQSLADPHPSLGATQKLNAKISATTLDDSYLTTAAGLRSSFRQRFRDSRFMEDLNRADLEATVLSRLQSLRLQYDSGEFGDSPAQFYARCVREMASLHSDRRFEKLNLPEGFFVGCMYEVTGRCAHRFVKGGA